MQSANPGNQFQGHGQEPNDTGGHRRDYGRNRGHGSTKASYNKKRNARGGFWQGQHGVSSQVYHAPASNHIIQATAPTFTPGMRATQGAAVSRGKEAANPGALWQANVIGPGNGGGSGKGAPPGITIDPSPAIDMKPNLAGNMGVSAHVVANIAADNGLPGSHQRNMSNPLLTQAGPTQCAADAYSPCQSVGMKFISPPPATSPDVDLYPYNGQFFSPLAGLQFGQGLLTDSGPALAKDMHEVRYTIANALSNFHTTIATSKAALEEKLHGLGKQFTNYQMLEREHEAIQSGMRERAFDKIAASFNITSSANPQKQNCQREATAALQMCSQHSEQATGFRRALEDTRVKMMELRAKEVHVLTDAMMELAIALKGAITGTEHFDGTGGTGNKTVGESEGGAKHVNEKLCGKSLVGEEAEQNKDRKEYENDDEGEKKKGEKINSARINGRSSKKSKGKKAYGNKLDEKDEDSGERSNNTGSVDVDSKTGTGKNKGHKQERKSTEDNVGSQL